MKYSEVDLKHSTPERIKRYQNSEAIMQVIGCLLNKPSLLRYNPLFIKDFVSNFHQYLYIAIHNMISQTNGAESIEPDEVEAYIKEGKYDPAKNNFIKNNGLTYLQQAKAIADPDKFDLYYNEVRKWGTLRELMSRNIDVSDFYDIDLLDHPDRVKEITAQKDRFDNATASDITNFFLCKIKDVSKMYDSAKPDDAIKVGGEEALAQLELWGKYTYGLSYASNFMTAATYGIKPTKFNIISAPQGGGKTRFNIANMCYSYCPEFWHETEKKWWENPHGKENSALYICTEMELRNEIEPIIQGYMANVPTDKIIENKMTPEEKERVKEAIIKSRRYDKDGNELPCGIYLVYMPNFTVAELRKIIEYYVIKYKVSAVFFDYIHENPYLEREYRAISGNDHSRTDQMLLNLSSELKQIARDYNISVNSSTQLNTKYKEEGKRDQEALRGATAIADKCDCGMIFLRPSKNELEKLRATIKTSKEFGKKEPTHSLTIYKNRGGRYNYIIIWLYIDFGTMRVHDLYVTDTDYELIPVPKVRTYLKENGEVFMSTLADADEQYKQGLIDEKAFKGIKAQERKDPSYSRNNAADRQRLERAEAATDEDHLEKLDEDFDF